ncbi:MAG: NIL domain-containing protein [Planctomycetota bacterium]
MSSRKIHCEFPQQVLEEPLFFRISRDFNVVPNIRGAEVTEEKGYMDIELEGEQDEILRVIDYLRELGVEVTDLG